MGYTKPKETTKWSLELAPLPNHGKSYTVVSHKLVIDNTLTLLRDSGFRIKKEIYRANMNANVAQGVYHITPIQTTDDAIIEETELGMMFAWTNSYDKSTRFQCAIGAYVKVCSNGMIAGEMMNFKRKHTGSADREVKVHLSDQIKNAEKYYKRIIQDRDAMKAVSLNCSQQSELVGRLFIDEDLLDTQQLSCVKSEMDKPTFDYNHDPDTAWTFYNHVTHALKKAHPRDWMQDSQDFHDFMTAECTSRSKSPSYEIDKNNAYVPTEETSIEIDEEILNEVYLLDL
tara:strand:+ start:86 stop:943 length:858 start_codon:yes stop_codon:yes gene_type:complete